LTFDYSDKNIVDETHDHLHSTMSTISEWDDEYARVCRAASQLRTTNYSKRRTSTVSREQQVNSIQSGLSRLHGKLSSLQASRIIPMQEAQRRKMLVDNLIRQVGSDGGGGNGGVPEGDLLGNSAEAGGMYNNNQQQNGDGGGRLTTTQALRNQDQMIDELASGVGRLKEQTLLVHDETNMQNRMLDDMDGDVEAARAGLEAETVRAMKLKEDQSVWRLYMVIAGLSVLLFVLITTGLS